MRENREDYWRRLCPVKALTEQIPPSAAEGSDYIFPWTQNGAVQDSAMQTAHQLYGDPLREPVSTQRTEQREDVGSKWDRPPHESPLPLSNFQEIILYFVKPAFLKSFKWQASFPQISAFRNILKMEYIFHTVLPTEAKQAISTNCYSIAVLAQTDHIFQVAQMIQNEQSQREKLNILWGD